MKPDSRNILWDYMTDDEATTSSIGKKYGKTSGRIGHLLSQYYEAVRDTLAEKNLTINTVVAEPEMIPSLKLLDASFRDGERERIQNHDQLEAERLRKERAKHLVLSAQTEIEL